MEVYIRFGKGDEMIDQELYDTLYALSESLGYKTYDTIPRKDANFPQVIIGETHILPRPNKSTLIGTVTARIHTWAESDNRMQASALTNAIYQAALNLKDTNSYRLNARLQACQVRMFTDNSTDKILWHGVIELEYQFY